MLVFQLITLISFVIGFLPVFRFTKDRFFYYILFYSLIDPIIFILRFYSLVKINLFDYLILVGLIQFNIFPVINKKIKIFFTFIYLIVINHYEKNPLVVLVMSEAVFGLIVVYLLELFFEEIKSDKRGSVYFILLVNLTALDGIKSYLYIENIGLAGSLFNYLNGLNISIGLLIFICGPNLKVKIPFVKKRWLESKPVELPILEPNNGNGKSLYHHLGKNNKYYLTERECEVLELVGKGFTNQKIADNIFISIKTVEYHRRAIKQKLGYSKRKQIVDFLNTLKILP
jgi:DNA-binding CsgD family transcriptional regulator